MVYQDIFRYLFSSTFYDMKMIEDDNGNRDTYIYLYIFISKVYIVIMDYFLRSLNNPNDAFHG